jgi:hypothetical protein
MWHLHVFGHCMLTSLQKARLARELLKPHRKPTNESTINNQQSKSIKTQRPQGRLSM